jgi:hypothetical protein
LLHGADYTGMGRGYGKLGDALIPNLSPRRDPGMPRGGTLMAGDAGG